LLGGFGGEDSVEREDGNEEDEASERPYGEGTTPLSAEECGFDGIELGGPWEEKKCCHDVDAVGRETE
jgi:hypothetical protein